MKDEGIVEGDIPIGDTAVIPCNRCLAVSYIDRKFTLKRVRIKPDKILLVSANPKYKTIEVSPDKEFRFGVWLCE